MEITYKNYNNKVFINNFRINRNTYQFLKRKLNWSIKTTINNNKKEYNNFKILKKNNNKKMKQK